jgi:protein-tyrosine phosphatase
MNPAPEGKFILVICEGNFCRSPMAMGLLRRGLDSCFRVESAGLAAREGFPAHPEALRLMAAMDIDLSPHATRQLTPAMALAADLILVMDQTQKDWCESLAPSIRGRVFLLGHWQLPSAVEIADPFPRGPEAFATAFEAIQQCVASWIPHLNAIQRSA